MDPLQFIAIVGISAGTGYVAASAKYVRQIRKMQQVIFSSSIESITRMTNAALATMVEDFSHPAEEAATRFFARCAAAGMQLVKMNTKTGEVSNITQETKK